MNKWINIYATLFILSVIPLNSSYCASIESQLQDQAREARKSLPMKVNDDIQATNMVAVGKIILNTYNFLWNKSELGNIDNLKSMYYRGSVNTACTNPDTLHALKLGVSVAYEYYDINNIFVMKYTIDQNTCRGIK